MYANQVVKIEHVGKVDALFDDRDLVEGLVGRVDEYGLRPSGNGYMHGGVVIGADVYLFDAVKVFPIGGDETQTLSVVIK